MPKQTPLGNGVEHVGPKARVGRLRLPITLGLEGTHACRENLLGLIIDFGDPSMHLVSCQSVHRKLW